jgi:branched-chain amino acid aminotransferase
MPSKYIWMDGKLVPFAKATVHVQTHGLHYGTSAFEGIRAYASSTGPKVLFLDQHIKRLYASAKMLRMEIPFAPEVLANAIKSTIKKNGYTSCYIRPICFRGDESMSMNPRRNSVRCAIITQELGAYLGQEAIERGIDAGISSWRRTAPGASMPNAKIGGQYVNSVMMVMEAQDHGYVEAIALDAGGFISEGSGENIFAVQNGVIYTPPMAGSILLGITRTGVLQLSRHLGYEVREQAFTREFLYLCDEAFFTGTAAEVTPIRSIDKLKVGNGSRGPITQHIQQAFFDIVQSKAEDVWEWLTPIK